MTTSSSYWEIGPETNHHRVSSDRRTAVTTGPVLQMRAGLRQENDSDSAGKLDRASACPLPLNTRKVYKINGKRISL